MLLTIKQPAHQGFKSFHDYTPPTPPATSRYSPAVTSAPSFPPLPITNKSLPPLTTTTKPKQQPMSTPHRGLPPPAAMTLPQPTQTQQPISQPPLSQPMGQLPAPPQQWQGAEESMRNWLQAKAEEDKRKQEEEKTRQETLRLEQRKIEQDMLRTSLTGGIPPYMIPMVFAGMGGGNLPNASLEWAQHYMAQAHHLQTQQVQQQQLLPSQAHTSPEQIQRRDSRASTFVQQHPVPITIPSTPVGPAGSQQSAGFVPTYQMSPRSRSNTQSSISRQNQTGHLPRLNTGEIHIQPPPPGPDHTTSPKKRKATGPQQAAPPPSSQPQYTSPPFSQAGSSVSNTPSSRKRGHSRQRSDMSARGGQEYRPSSRQRHTESSYSHQGAGSPHGTSVEQGPSAEPRSGASNPVSSILEHSDSRPTPQGQYQFSAGPEMRGQETRRTPERKGSR
ncbi:hypothetical protein BP6252_10588 [Coleophoma cylindrospora]|uniref:Uncharacterized protein n=1 Tax=Coleophoma cylindrospora TaxID=1849047 RepID=A0A3D8QT26_9HELO|nr:hypothetical protein BP6252_10588 [Coleophoma cylindrospora]